MEKCANQITEIYNGNFKALMNLRSGKSLEPEAQIMNMVKVRQTAIDQIKRCCCSYLNERMLRIKHLRWKSGGHLSENVKANLSEHELKWLNTYNGIIYNYQENFGENENDGINLLNHVDPPEKILVKVRAVKDSGHFEISDGTSIVFDKGTIHHLPRQDCENLVRRGVLEYINQ